MDVRLTRSRPQSAGSEAEERCEKFREVRLIVESTLMSDSRQGMISIQDFSECPEGAAL